MIKIKYEDTTYEIKNSPDEFLIKEFEHVCAILNNKEKTALNKWTEVFIYLGVPEEVVDDFDAAAFMSIIKEFNINDLSDTDIKKEIILDEVTYQAYTEDEFKLTVKEMALIEGFMTKNQERYLGDILAVIYKRPDVDRKMNFDKAHLHHKAELIRKQVTADVVIPLIKFMSKRLLTDLNTLTNE